MESSWLIDQFDLERGRAVNSYALLEDSLGQVLEALFSSSYNAGSIVISNVVSSRSRYSIIRSIFATKKYYQVLPVWEKFTRCLVSADKQRNKAVHWLRKFETTGAMDRVLRVFLENPVESATASNHYRITGEFLNVSRIYLHDLKNSADYFDLVERALFSFHFWLSFPRLEERLAAQAEFIGSVETMSNRDFLNDIIAIRI
ncbi:hypothetical protein [Sphingomonas sp.]|uniref:hypothetical protein n=1 Tax=Sphingomonas sp. TaxID=28214 RepID=UPI0025D2966C|nr:hypothetical protein [Sphingomonas sp.]